MNNKELLDWKINKLKEINSKQPHAMATLLKLELIKKNPEWENKLTIIRAKDVFCTSNRDEIVYLEVGRIEV